MKLVLSIIATFSFLLSPIGLMIVTYTRVNALPSGHSPCEPLHSSVKIWDKTGTYTVDFDKIKNAVKMATDYIPNIPEPSASGKVELSAFKKTACCAATDQSTSELRKGSIAGTFSAGVDSGQLPLPGFSVPNVGGLYIKSTADASVSLSGESIQECNSNYNKLSLNFTVQGSVTLEGGGNALNGWLYVGIRGSGTISGGGEWEEDQVPKWQDGQVSVSAEVVVGGFMGELTYTLAQVNESFSNS
jgi:hypothetical protein